MLFDVDVVLVLDIDLRDLIMNDGKIDLNLLNVLVKDYLYDYYEVLIEDWVKMGEHVDSEDCRIEVDDMDENSAKEIHVWFF